MDNKTNKIEDDNEIEKKNIDIEVITGDGKNLNISPVYNHVKVDKPDIKRNKKKDIIVPKTKNKK